MSRSERESAREDPFADLRDELLAMAETDERVRTELTSEGTLSASRYHPRMEAVHRRHALRLGEILSLHGWPGHTLVGEEAAEAAWLILQHAIGDPDLQRTSLRLLWKAVRKGETEPRHAAYLTDRIAFFEERPQRFGTQFDWDAEGKLSPWRIEDPDRVDRRRAEVGLPPLEEQITRERGRAEAEGERPPDDFAAYIARRREWAEKVGWLERASGDRQ